MNMSNDRCCGNCFHFDPDCSLLERESDGEYITYPSFGEGECTFEIDMIPKVAKVEIVQIHTSPTDRKYCPVWVAWDDAELNRRAQSKAEMLGKPWNTGGAV